MKFFTQKSTLLTALLLSNAQLHAAGFDNSYFPFQIFTGKSRIEGASSATNATVKPKMVAETVTALGTHSYPKTAVLAENIYNTRYNPSAGIHYNVKDWLGLTYQYEKPFATDTNYQDNAIGAGFPIHSYLNTNLHSFGANYIKPYSIGFINVIGGIQILTGTGSFSTDGWAGDYGPNDNINANLDFGNNTGGFFGVSYEIPAFAVQLQFMYYTNIDATATGSVDVGTNFYTPICSTLDTVTEQTPGTCAAATVNGTSANITTDSLTVSPKRWHLYAQSGIAPNWLGFAGYSYVNWQALPNLTSYYTNPEKVNPFMAGTFSDAVGLGLFEDNGNYWYFGVGNKVTEKLVVTLSAFYDVIRDNPVDDFRVPTRGSNSYSFGSQYAATDKLTLKGRYTYVSVPQTDIVYSINNPFIQGSYQASVDPTAHSVNVGFEYLLS